MEGPADDDRDRVGIVERWVYFFREAENFETIPPALNQEPFREALEVARVASFTAQEWMAYDRAKMAEQDARGALNLAEKRDRAEGREEGPTEGMVELLLRPKRSSEEWTRAPPGKSGPAACIPEQENLGFFPER